MTTFPTAEQVKLTDVIAPSFYEVHRDIAAGVHTYYYLDGGRGSVKSTTIGSELILGIMRDAQHGIMSNAVAFRRYKEQLHDSVFEQLLWCISKLGVESQWKATVSPLRLTFIPTGQVILFRGADKVKKAKSIMIESMKNDFEKRFHDPDGRKMHLEMAYTYDLEAAEAFKKEVQEAFPNNEIVLNPLSLSVSCHIGPGALAIACSKVIE